MYDIANAMLTAPRPGVNYAVDSLRSIETAGFESPHVFAEPNSPMIPGVSFHVAETTLHSWPNWLRALRWLLEHRPHAEAFLIWQDDVLVAKHSREWIESQMWCCPDAGVYSLYAAESQVKREEWEGDGWHLIRRPPFNCYGALAILMPPWFARNVSDNPPIERHVKGAGPDTHLGSHCRRHGIGYAVHVPSVVQHVGAVSCVRTGKLDPGINRHRRAYQFCDDCRRLPSWGENRPLEAAGQRG